MDRNDLIAAGIICATILSIIMSIQACDVKNSKIGVERYKIKMEACKVTPSLCIPAPTTVCD